MKKGKEKKRSHKKKFDVAESVLQMTYQISRLLMRVAFLEIHCEKLAEESKVWRV